MSSILITGASGFIGKALAAEAAKRYDVVCLSRKYPGDGRRWIRGDFADFEDLRGLDGFKIDTVVHLAAVTGGCLERDGMLVNVEGARCLMRYLIDRGCRKFVMASSIAAVGMQSPKFRPRQLPIPDEHPCLDRDGYGFSKFLMEEVTKYYHRQNPDIDVINLRLASIGPDEKMPPPRKPCPLGEWALGTITVMALSDAVRACLLAIEAPPKAGVRILNAVGPKSWVAAPVAEILRTWWGAAVDVSFYEQRGHERDAVYDPSLIRKELGFTAERLP
jgi:UDP-glucose 4-epimerase